MNDDPIQAIWDSQQPVAISNDRQELTQWIDTRARHLDRTIGLVEIMMTATLVFVAVMFMKDPVLQRHDLILIVPGIFSLAAAAFVWSGRIARKKREINFDTSLKGIAEKSLHGINYQIRRMQSFVWWFAAPCTIGLIIGLFIVDADKRYLLWGVFIPAFIACMAATIWQIRKEIQRKLLPEKQKLEELLKNLESQPE